MIFHTLVDVLEMCSLTTNDVDGYGIPIVTILLTIFFI